MHQRARVRAWAAVWLLAVAAAGCVRFVTPPPGGADAGPCGGDRRTDEFMTSGSTSLDVLVVVDDSPASVDLLPMVGDRLDPLFREIMMRSDFHVAFAPTSALGLLARVPASTAGDPAPCDGCRYLTRAMCRGDDDHPCSNLMGEARKMAGTLAVQQQHPAPSRMVATLVRALGIFPLAGEVTPHADPPRENAGFYRPDAGLIVFFVTAGDDPDATAADEMRYTSFLRIMRNLKGLGRDGNVVVATVAAAPKTALQDMATASATDCSMATDTVQMVDPADFCPMMHALMTQCMATQLDSRSASQCAAGTMAELARTVAPSAATAMSALPGCSSSPDTGPVIHATAAPNLLGLTCDLQGVVYNACAANWTSIVRGRIRNVLDQRGVFRLVRPPTTDRSSVAGCPSTPGSLCVEVQTSEGRTTFIDGATVEEKEGVYQVALGELLPGSRVRVSYNVAEGDTHCCAEGCNSDEFCNAAGYCQSSSCRGQATCPAGALCDPLTGTCIPASTCTRDEHCPFLQRCDCTSSTCVPDAGMPPEMGD